MTTKAITPLRQRMIEDMNARTLHQPASSADAHEITALRSCRHRHSARSTTFIVATSHAGGWRPPAPASMRLHALLQHRAPPTPAPLREAT
jgi:hypothetical protein